MKVVERCEFDGAKGTCGNCGTEISLEWGDTGVSKRTYASWNDEQKSAYGKEFPVWNVKCPTCGVSVECSFLKSRQ